MIGVNKPARDVLREQADEFDDPTLDDVGLLDEPQHGRFVVDAPSDEDILVYATRVDGDATVELSADVPFELIDDTVDGPPVTIGTPLRQVADGFTYDVIHPVELRAGEEIEITVNAGTSDAYFTLLEPGEEYDQLAEPAVDDGGGGLYDLDPRESFTIERSGAYRVVVGTWDGVVGGYELDVHHAD